ncbi:MAG: M20/M25/M40 family metallo-hydrolase [Planctomycetota bacterium]|nr:M20/M25/M40 family metallo-hydrolase [Planctomycetota bacterium]
MALGEVEQAVCRTIEGKRAELLADLRLHVGFATGLNNTPALDQSRELFSLRLRALGAMQTLVPGDPKPEWLDRGPARPSEAASGGATRPVEANPGAEIPPTAVLDRTRTRGGARVMLAGHLDTVHDPAGTFRELVIAPDGRTATGPGVVDMKGGLVIMVAALEALEACGVPLAWTVVLNSDEETGSYHSERVLSEQARKHDVGIAMEPALPDGSLAIARPGSGQFRLECFGRAAHVGRDFVQGVSAVTALAESLLKVASFANPDEGRIASVGPIGGGHATNVVPDFAWAAGNVRFSTPEAESWLAAAIDGLADDSLAGSIAAGIPAQRKPSEASAINPRATTRVYRSFNRAPKPRTPGTERLAHVAQLAAEDLGQKLPFATTGGVCDGNIMQAAGLPTIDTMGVRGGGLHTPTEWIELASLVERCQLLAVTLARLHAGDEADRAAPST